MADSNRREVPGAGAGWWQALWPYWRPGTIGPALVALLLGVALLYGGYFWFVRRVVVGPNEVLVLLKKYGSRSLESDQIIIPRPPEPSNSAAYAAWDKAYKDVNGILEVVYPP